MKTKTQSEPRFRQISTSRIKDGRLLEHNHPIKNMVLSGKKIENKQKYLFIHIALSFISQIFTIISKCQQQQPQISGHI